MSRRCSISTASEQSPSYRLFCLTVRHHLRLVVLCHSGLFVSVHYPMSQCAAREASHYPFYALMKQFAPPGDTRPRFCWVLQSGGGDFFVSCLSTQFSETFNKTVRHWFLSMVLVQWKISYWGVSLPFLSNRHFSDSFMASVISCDAFINFLACLFTPVISSSKFAFQVFMRLASEFIEQATNQALKK